MIQESAKSDEEKSADYEHEKEELRMWLTVVSDKEETMDPGILSTKYTIVDWEYQNLGNVDMEDLYVYKIIRANGNISYNKSLSSMLRKFDRQDLVDLHRLVMKRFKENTPEGDEEEAYPFVNKYPRFQEEYIVLVEEESCPVYDTDNEEEESMPVYDTDIEDIIEEEEGFVKKGGFVEEESCPIYDTDNEEEESMPVYDTDIEDVIEEEEGFVEK
uniref:Uncharacterized protein n=1 Tax=Tanacetum cinerariifolium TaxID=118510 RepID=A0A6L2M3A5_TANCI|nr:hypothetical protein [Tanacetum cinerariifolium]